MKNIQMAFFIRLRNTNTRSYMRYLQSYSNKCKNFKLNGLQKFTNARPIIYIFQSSIIFDIFLIISRPFLLIIREEGGCQYIALALRYIIHLEIIWILGEVIISEGYNRLIRGICISPCWITLISVIYNYSLQSSPHSPESISLRKKVSKFY